MVRQEVQSCAIQPKKCLSSRLCMVIDIMLSRIAQLIIYGEHVSAAYANIHTVLDMSNLPLMAAD